jgi:5-methylcytosine-specific restriction endonuclease McrA
MNYKICTKCGKEFPATDEFFYGDKRGEYRGRLRAACKICQRPSKEKKVVHSATYRKNNKEKIRISDAEYYQNNKERVAIYGAKYRKANPDKIAAKYARREVHKLNQTPVLTEAENQQVIDIYKKRKELGSNWHVDHAVPLSKGGLHHPDNLQIVLKKYNLQKGSKLNFRLPTDTEIYKFRPVQDNT